MVSQWRVAEIMTMDEATLKTILDLQREHYMLYGSWPSVAAIKKLLLGG